MLSAPVKKKVLLTRPRASSERWADLLENRGFESVTEPLLILTPTGAPRPEGAFQAVMITSANAIDALRDRKTVIDDLLRLPCFCVGGATGDAARAFGFVDIRCGDTDGAGLAHIMVITLTDKASPILHLSGDTTDTKAHDILAKNGFTLAPWPVYRADAVDDFTAATRTAFATGEFSVIPVFSPRSARVLVSIIEKNRLTTACHAITAIALSQAVANVLQTLPWQRLQVARRPTEEDVLACLSSDDPMTLPETKTAPIAAAKKKRCWPWFMLCIIILAAAMAAALIHSPWAQRVGYVPVAGGENAQTIADLAALQQRVQILEHRLDTLKETPVAQEAPQTGNSADVAALNDTVKNLQAQITQLQNQSQKSLAAAMAFWDLRDVARGGRPFATQLAALRAASAGDAATTEQAARLDAYATSGAPTFAQLRDVLVQTEPAAADAPLPESPTWRQRLQSLLQNLVSVHPLNDPQFAALENALNASDGLAASEAFKALPMNAQQHLAAWREKFDARMTVDDALHALQMHFSAVSDRP